jgi:hypothetical protein
MEMSGQLRAPATLSQNQCTEVHWVDQWVGPSEWSSHKSGEGKSLSGMNTRLSSL